MVDGPPVVFFNTAAQVQPHGSHGSHESQGPMSDDVGASHEGHGPPPAMLHHGDHGDHGDGGSHAMPMAFHSGNTETILFNFWRTESTMFMGLSCLLIFLVAVFYEGLKFYREWLFDNNKAKRLKAGRDQYGQPRRNREQEYRFRPPTYSYRVPQPQQQMQQGQVPPYIYRPPLSTMAPHHPHSDYVRPQSPQSTQLVPHQNQLPHGRGHHHIQPPEDPDGDRKVPWRRRWFSRLHLIQTFLHVLQVLISFLLMLVFMTFNVWLCLAVLLGAGVGYYIFCAFSNRIHEHCN